MHDLTTHNAPGIAVYGFAGQYRFLSNFYEGEPIVLPGTVVEYRTGEHAYQALKTLDEDHRFYVSSQPTPGKAKKAGRNVSLRPNWEEIKFDAMIGVLRAKFAPHRKEAELLLATQDAYLCEGNYWRDRVWGVDCNGLPPWAGRNWLGSLLLLRRAELRANRDFGVEIPDGSENMRVCL